MRHARVDYNRIQDPAGLIPEDEPVFLLRAQDTLAPGLLRMYAEAHRLLPGADPMVAELCWQQAHDMMVWQNKHGRKTADLPPSCRPWANNEAPTDTDRPAGRPDADPGTGDPHAYSALDAGPVDSPVQGDGTA